MCFLFVPGLEGSSSDSSSQCPPLVPSVTWRGKPLQRRVWLREWKKGSWIKLLSGTTCEPSTASRGVASWIASLLASRASRIRSQARGKAEKTSAGSGQTSLGFFVRYDRDSSFWRTSQGSLLPGLEKFSGTWPASGSMRNGACSQRQESERHISGNGSSSWPTATAQTYGRNKGGQNPEGQERPSLETMAKVWPTIMVSDVERGSGMYMRGNPTLTGAARVWSTPNASMAEKERYNPSQFNRHSPGLQAQAIEPYGKSLLIRAALRLNPQFVGWLMGLPIGWTDFAPLETRSFRSWLHAHSSLLRDALR